MGKRGAVRNNSGLPVDHSGPGLKVGPTTPPTSDRKSEACPPNSGVDSDFGVGVGLDSDFALDVGVDAAVDSLSSQHKSGREPESRALSDAHEASGVLRSEAKQRFSASSLDLLKSNRYTSALSELQAKGRKKYCGARTLRGRSGNGRSEELLVRLDCKTWGCAYCGPRKAKRYKGAIRAIAERDGLNRFLTLTLDPRKIEGDPVRYLRQVFNKFRVYLLRRYGHSIKYITVLEFHKSGIPHLHVLVDRYIPQEWISQAWSSLGGGKIVHIKIVDVHRISHYLAKYLTKELLLSAPARSRRITTSRSICLIAKKDSALVWAVSELSIFHWYSIFYLIAQNTRCDEEGFVSSFSIPSGVFTGQNTTLTLVRAGNGEITLFFMQ